MDRSEHHHHHDAAAHGGGPLMKDPVCGMDVDPASAAGIVQHNGTTYYFCNQKCVALFKANPEEFVAEAEKSAAERSAAMPAAAGAKYTCPMHPEIVRDGPGACPICGMALEPMSPVAGAEESNPELEDMTRRFWIALVLTAPVLVEMVLPERILSAMLAPARMQWLTLVLATPVVVWAGWPFFERGYQSLRTRNLNMFTLIATGVGVAWVYSVIATIIPGVFPAAQRDVNGLVPTYFEAAATIVVLVLLGQVLELRARSQTSGAIRALLGLAPKTARRIADDGGEADVPLDEIRPGDRLRVR